MATHVHETMRIKKKKNTLIITGPAEKERVMNLQSGEGAIPNLGYGKFPDNWTTSLQRDIHKETQSR